MFRLWLLPTFHSFASLLSLSDDDDDNDDDDEGMGRNMIIGAACRFSDQIRKTRLRRGDTAPMIIPPALLVQSESSSS